MTSSRLASKALLSSSSLVSVSLSTAVWLEDDVPSYCCELACAWQQGNGATYLFLKVGELGLLFSLEVLDLLGRLVARVLELLCAVCGTGVSRVQYMDGKRYLQVRAFWTILAASFSASSRVWMPCDCCAACEYNCQWMTVKRAIVT